MVLSKTTLDTLAKVGWKFTAFEASEQGRRDEIVLGSIERSRKCPRITTTYKVLAAVSSAFAGLYYSPAWIAAGFIGLSAYKDFWVSLKRQYLVNAVRTAKQRLFLVHETMGNIRSQSVVLITSNRSQQGQLAAKLINQWNQFTHLIDAFGPVCTNDLLAELNKQKEVVVTSLEALRTASKGKKSQKLFETALKAAHKALKALTEPQEPRGILTKIYIRAELAVTRTQEHLNTYLAPSF